MPKAKWGSDLTPDDIESAESGSAYAGPCPPSGVYQFVLKKMQQAESANGNPKLYMIWEVTKKGGTKDQSKFAGAPLFDHMPVGKSSAFRSKALCAGLGVTSKEFLGKTVIDDDSNVIKIGSLKIEIGKTTIFANVKKDNDPEYGERIVLNGGGYLPKPEQADDADDDDDDDTDDGEADPF